MDALGPETDFTIEKRLKEWLPFRVTIILLILAVVEFEGKITSSFFLLLSVLDLEGLVLEGSCNSRCL